jgi:hypothetical protein
VVDAQMEILAQCMEACQALFMLEEKQNYWMGQMRKRERPGMAIFCDCDEAVV